MTSNGTKGGPRFIVGSTRPADGPSVVDELIGLNTPQVPPVTSDSELVGTITPRAAAEPAIAKFGNGGAVPTLEECEQHIRTATSQWLISVGRALAAIRDHDLFRTAGYDSFTAYVRHRQPLGMQPPQVTRLIQALPVVEALEGRTDREIKEGQARVLVPVLKHGADAVREVWDAAARSGYPSAAALERVAREKNYLDGEPAPDDSPAPPPAPSSPVLQRYQKALAPFEDLRGLSTLAKEEPDAARLIAGKLRQALHELEADLPEE